MAEAPGEGKRVEGCPAVLGSEIRRAVVAPGVGGEVSIIEIIGTTCEKRGHGTVAESVADRGCAVAEGRVVHLVAGQVGVLDVLVVPAARPCFLSYHGGERVLSDLVGIGHVILQCPELVGILLHRTGVRVTRPCAEIDGRLVALTFRPAEVPVVLGVPGEFLHELHIEEDVAREFLTGEQDVVHQGHCDGVGVGIALLANRRIIAVEVVDRYAWDGGERIVDEALVRVGELEALVGVGIADAEAHLEPRLHLRIDVGAEREALELRTDDGAVLVHVAARNEVFHFLVTTLCTYLVLVL